MGVPGPNNVRRAVQKNPCDRDHATKEMLVVVGSNVCATSPNNTQQHATGCANGRNKSDIQQSWELFGPTLLRPFNGA